MRWNNFLEALPLRLSSLFRRAQLEGDLEAELGYHVEQQIAANLASGMPPEQARDEALRRLGSLTRTKEECRESWGWHAIQMIVGDSKVALRRLTKDWPFSIAAVLILALGIGANTIVFSAINSFLFRSHGFQGSGLRVNIYQNSGDPAEPAGVSYPTFRDIAASNGPFTGVAAVLADDAQYQGPGDLQSALIEYTTSGYLSVAGSNVAAGRWFTPLDDLAGEQGVAVVGFRTWQSRFASDGGIIGRTIRLNGAPVTIVGIGPKDLTSATHPTLVTDFWLSMSALPSVEAGTFRAGILERRGDLVFDVRARLKEGVGVAQARAGTEILSRRLAADHPETDPGKGMTVIASDEVVIHPGEPDRLIALSAAALLAVVGLVLAIACSNLATLLLVRGTSRAAEVSVRLAIGATRWQLVRHFLTESVLLSLLGSVAGIVLAHWGILYLSTQIPFGFDIHTDYRVLLFALVLSILTGIAFGLAPALRSTRINLVSALRGEIGGSASSGRGLLSLKNGLLGVQVVGSFVLIMGAAVLLRAMSMLQSQAPGFAVQGVALVGTNPRYAGYEAADAQRINQEILRRIRTIPGVQSVFATMGPAVGSSVGREIDVEDSSDASRKNVESTWASPGYFQTLQIPLLFGREFDDRDLPGRPSVVIVNETMARQVFGSLNAVGRRFRYGGVQQSREDKLPVEIVGVVRDTSSLTLTATPDALFYLPVAQAGAEVSTIVARSSFDAASLAQAMQREIRNVDPALPVFQARTMVQQLEQGLFLYRRGIALLGGLGTVALLLAAVGLYSVVRFAVLKRAVELGIRVALGARANQVVWLVMRDVSTVVGVSIGVGVVLSVWTISVMRSFIANGPGGIEIRGTDSFTVVAVALLMAISAGAAAYFPARRAAHADPIAAIRRL